MKSTFIAWVRYDRRPELLAHHLGASVHYIARGRRGQLAQAPVRYGLQAGETWRLLRQERPAVVFVQNPPVFAVMVAALYAKRYGARYVVDSHSAAFLSPKWRWSLGIQHLLAQGAAATIVPNDQLGKIVGGWGCRTLTIGFTPGEYPVGERFPLERRLNVAVVSTFAEDEPLDVVFEAASALPETSFYVTGDATAIAPRLLARKPDNCCLTGYLPYGHYVGLLRQVDAVLDLTTRDHTLLMGAFEAVSLGTPLIVSDWPVLRDYFSRGTVHIPNTVAGICAGVRRVQREQESLRREILLLREELHAEWQQKLVALRQVLGAC